MGTLQRAINEQIKTLPEKALAELLRKKLKAAGIRAYRKKSDELAALLILHGSDDFEWDGIDKDTVIHFDRNDEKELRKITERYADVIGDVVIKLSKVFAKKIARDYSQNWREIRYKNVRHLQGFRDRIEDRWGDGLDALRILLDFSMEMGQKYQDRFARSRSKKNVFLRHALSRLHTRGCQVSNEIIVLLENGYPDGAMARWRTLHEIVTVAFLINDGGDVLAERYIAYDVVEAKKAFDELCRHREMLNLKGPSRRSMREVDAQVKAAVDRFGADFKNSYGWAADFVKNRFPRFVDIQALAGTAMMQFDYKIASLNVHATPRALTTRIGSLRSPDHLIAGATNAGLSDPAESLAITIPKLTHLLMTPTNSIDNAVNLGIMLNFREAAIKAFTIADKNLWDEHQSILHAIRDAGEDVEISWDLI